MRNPAIKFGFGSPFIPCCDTLILWGLVCCSFVFTPHTSSLFAQDAIVGQFAADALRDFGQPGVAIAVVRPHRASYLAAINQPGTPAALAVGVDDIFPLASCSKALTVAVLATLVDEGKLAWDDPVRKYLPDFHLADPNADQLVTIRDLLTHRTGVPGHDDLWYRYPGPPGDLIAKAKFLPLTQAFRGSFQYQSVMVVAAGECAAKASGQPWDVLVRERLFTPLGMAGASCITPTTAKRAVPMKRRSDGGIETLPWYEQREPNPAGSIHCRLRDLVPWLQLHLNAGIGPGRRLISVAQVSEMHAPQQVLPLDALWRSAHPETIHHAYALGWVVQDYRGHLLLSHAGVIDGFRCHLAMVPRAGVAVAVLSPISISTLPLALSNRTLDYALGLPERPWNALLATISAQEALAKAELLADWEKRREAGPTQPLTDYAGAFEHPAYGRATITVVAGTLRFHWRDTDALLLFHHGQTFDIQDERLRTPPLTFAPERDRFSLWGVPFERQPRP